MFYHHPESTKVVNHTILRYRNRQEAEDQPYCTIPIQLKEPEAFSRFSQTKQISHSTHACNRVKKGTNMNSLQLDVPCNKQQMVITLYEESRLGLAQKHVCISLQLAPVVCALLQALTSLSVRQP